MSDRAAAVGRHATAQRKPIHPLATLAIALSAALAAIPDLDALAFNPEWKLLLPSNTGIPGEEIRCVGIAPDGTPWIGARWIFWQEGGFGVLDRQTSRWTSYVDYETPLPTEMVNDIEFAEDGAVWIATNAGLVKKDGDAWTVYRAANSPLLHDEIREIEFDSQGHLWINNTNPQNQNAALFEFDGVNWRSFAVPQIPWQDPWRQLDGLVIDANDHVWIGNWTLPGVAEFDGTNWTLRGASMDILRPVAVDNANGVWVFEGHLQYDAYRWNGSQFVRFGGGIPPLWETTLTDLAQAPDGAIYLGNWNAQIARSTNLGATWSFFTTIEDLRVTTIEPAPDNELWVGGWTGVHRFDASGSLAHVYNTWNTGLPDFWIDGFDRDPQGNMWFASGDGGLSRLSDGRWRNWGEHNSGSEPYPFAGNEPMGCFYMDDTGTGWMGGNGIARWEPETGQFTGFWNWQNNPGMGVTLFEHILQDGAGTLFACDQDGGIFWFDGTRWIRDTSVTPYVPLGLPGAARTSDGDLWVAGWFALHHWNGSTWTTVGEDWPLFDMGGVNCIGVDLNDVLWIGTPQGMLQWDGANLSVFTTANSPLTASNVVAFAFREDGLAAVAAIQELSEANSAVILIDGPASQPGNWEPFRVANTPIPHWQLEALEFDGNGNLWISALSRGVALMQLQDPADVDESLTARNIHWAAPNPFRTEVSIRFSGDRPGMDGIAVYDTAGRLVRRLTASASGNGEHRASWDGRDESGREVESGIYFAKIGSPTPSLRLIKLR